MGRKIIAVDDSEIALELIVATLADFGYEDVESFRSPVQALEAISNQQGAADLILLDVMMPEMDGIELCARIRALDAWRDVPIIMLTSRTDTDSLSRAFLAGANDYLTKPFERMEFQARLTSLLRLKSELDRRKATPRAAAARRARGVAERVPGLLGNRATLEDALAGLEGTDLDRLAVYVLSADAVSANRADFDDERRAAIRAAVAGALAGLPAPAGEILVYWGEDTFAAAGLGEDSQALLDRLARTAAAVERTLGTLPRGQVLAGAPETVSLGAALPGSARSAAEALGNAFKALETAKSGGGGQVSIAGQHEREQ